MAAAAASSVDMVLEGARGGQPCRARGGSDADVTWETLPFSWTPSLLCPLAFSPALPPRLRLSPSRLLRAFSLAPTPAPLAAASPATAAAATAAAIAAAATAAAVTSAAATTVAGPTVTSPRYPPQRHLHEYFLLR